MEQLFRVTQEESENLRKQEIIRMSISALIHHLIISRLFSHYISMLTNSNVPVVPTRGGLEDILTQVLS